MIEPREVEIANVTLPALDKHQCWGSYVDMPGAATTHPGYAIPIEGWVFGRRAAALSVDIVHASVPVQQTPVNLQRPDIVAAFPNVDAAERTGFRTALSSLRLPRIFELELYAVLADGSRPCIGIIRGRRPALIPSPSSAMQPLLMVTLGRTGSTWLSMLLSQHPQVVCYRPLRYEPRVMTYWLDVLRTLSEPRSYLQTVRGDLGGEHWWIGDRRVSPLPPPLVDADVQTWLARDHVDSLVEFCRDRVESQYRQIATSQGQSNARFFVEKVWPDEVSISLAHELYPAQHEVFLVRDFRDMACSILAFNQKRGQHDFGRERVGSDAEFLRELRTSAIRLLECWHARRDRAVLLRYEDLIRRPDETISSLLKHLDIDRNATILRDIFDRARSLMPDAQRHHRTTADADSSIGRWRRDLSPDLKAVCHDALGDILQEFGYEIA